MKKEVFKFYGRGLGDHLQYSTLPELFLQKKIKFFLSKEVKYRNEEVLDLVWRKNPYFCGFSDAYPTIDFNQSDEYSYQYNIQSIERQNDLLVCQGNPKIYYEPLRINDFFGKTIIDLNTITCQYETKYLTEKIKEIISFNNIKEEDLVSIEFKHENWYIYGEQELKNYISEIKEFKNIPRYKVKSIYEYCDIIFSCKNVISVYSGGASLACAVKNAGISPNIHVIANEKYKQTSNHKYMNANYYYICDFNKEYIEEKSKIMKIPSSLRKELYKQAVSLDLKYEDYDFCLPPEIVSKTKLEKIRFGVLKDSIPESIYKGEITEVEREIFKFPNIDKIYFYNFIKIWDRFENFISFVMNNSIDSCRVNKIFDLNKIDLNDNRTLIFIYMDKDDNLLLPFNNTKCKKVLMMKKDKYCPLFFDKIDNLEKDFEVISPLFWNNNLDKGKYKDVLIPSFGFSKIGLDLKEKRIDFEEKQNKLFFLGRLTGKYFRFDFFKMLKEVIKDFDVDLEVIIIEQKKGVKRIESFKKEIVDNNFKIIDKGMNRRKYFEIMNKCKYHLCPFGAGEGSFRVLEAMSLGGIALSHDLDHMDLFGGYKDKVNYLSIGSGDSLNLMNPDESLQKMRDVLSFITNDDNQEELVEISRKGMKLYQDYYSVEKGAKNLLYKEYLNNVIKKIEEDNFMEKTVFQFYGSGLGDHLQFSTLPELFLRKKSEFYLSNEVKYRNEEVLDLVWKKNPYFCGFTDDYPTIEFVKSDEYKNEYYIQTIEQQNGCKVGNGYPKIYYEPLQRNDFIGKTIIDLNTITCQYDKNLLYKKIKEIILLENIGIKDIVFMEFQFENWYIYGEQELKNYISEIKEFKNIPRYKVKSIYEYCDIIFSCKNVISVYSGGASLACAVKNAGTSPNIHVIANSEYKKTSNHKYVNANYYYIQSIKNLYEKEKLELTRNSNKKKIYKEDISLEYKKEKLELTRNSNKKKIYKEDISLEYKKEKLELMKIPSSVRKGIYKKVVRLNLEYEDDNFYLPSEIVNETKLKKIKLGVLKSIIPKEMHKKYRRIINKEKKINQLISLIKKIEPSPIGKTAFIGPWVGEFGIEVFGWQGYVRKKCKEYDKVIVCSRFGHEEIYNDFCDQFIPHYYKEQNKMLGIGDDQLQDFNLDIDESKFDIFIPFTIGYEEYITEHGSINGHDTFFDQEFVEYGQYDIRKKYDILIHARNKKNLEVKNLSMRMWNKIISHFARKGLKIACIGSENATFFMKNADDFRDVSLNELANLMRSSTMLVSVDSGPVHFAALCGCPRLTWAVNIKEQIETHWNPFNTPSKILGEIGSAGREQKITSKEVINGIEDFMRELKGE